jgi:hypothetical protein
MRDRWRRNGRGIIRGFTSKIRERGRRVMDNGVWR